MHHGNKAVSKYTKQSQSEYLLSHDAWFWSFVKTKYLIRPRGFYVCALYACMNVQWAVRLPIMPLTVPNSTEPWVGVELSPRFCSTSEPWQNTLTNSPRWNTPTSCKCCRSSSVVAALAAGRTAGGKCKERLQTLKDMWWWGLETRSNITRDQKKNAQTKTKYFKSKAGKVWGPKWSIKPMKDKHDKDMWGVGKGQKVIER